MRGRNEILSASKRACLQEGEPRREASLANGWNIVAVEPSELMCLITQMKKCGLALKKPVLKENRLQFVLMAPFFKILFLFCFLISDIVIFFF